MTRPTAEPDSGAAPRQTAWRVALVLGVFTAVMAVLLLVNAWRMHQIHPLDHPELAQIKEQVRQSPADAQLIEAYRELDAELRGAFFQRQSNARIGAWLLMVLATATLVAARWRLPEARPPSPARLRSTPTPAAAQGPAVRWALGATAAILGVVGLSVGLGSITHARHMQNVGLMLAAESETDPTAAADPTVLISTADESPSAASADEGRDLDPARQWPSFRGPGAAGRAFADRDSRFPRRWDGETGLNVLWRTSIDLPGHNSPVVWGDLLFISGADQQQRKLYAIEINDGSLRWEHRAPILANGGEWPPPILPDTGYAAPTCATNGRMVFAIFPNGDLIACDMQGRRVWSKALGEAENMYGHASSLAWHEDLLFVQWDQSDVNRLYALDADTGEKIWVAEHEAGASWASPAVHRTSDSTQLIRVSNDATFAYEPETGKILWHYPGPRGDIASTPVGDESQVLVVSPAWAMYALPTTLEGEIGEEQVRWTFEDHMPEVASPIVVGSRAVVIDDYGQVTGLDMADGSKRFEYHLEGLFQASPVSVDSLLYLTDADGRTTVLDIAEDEPQVVGSGRLDEAVRASPAMVEGRVYIRSESAVYGIGEVDYE